MGNELSSDKTKPTLTRTLSLKVKRTDQAANFSSKSPDLVRPLRRSYTFSTYEDNVTSDGFSEKTHVNSDLNIAENRKVSFTIDNKTPLLNNSERNEIQHNEKRQNSLNNKNICNKKMNDDNLKNIYSFENPIKKNLYSKEKELSAKETPLTDGLIDVIHEGPIEKKSDKGSTRRKGLKASAKKVARSHSFHCHVVEEEKNGNVNEKSFNNKGVKMPGRRNSDTFLLKMEHVQKSEHFSKMLKQYKEKDNVNSRKLSIYSGKIQNDALKCNNRLKLQTERTDTYLENWINDQKERINALSKAVQGDYEYYHALRSRRKSLKGSDILELPKRPSTEKLRRKVLSKPTKNLSDYSSDEEMTDNPIPRQRVLSELVINPCDVTKVKPSDIVTTSTQKGVQFKPIRSVITEVTFLKPNYKKSDYSFDSKDINQNEIRQTDQNKTIKTSTQIAFGIHSDKKLTKKFNVITAGSFSQIKSL